jgi:hypothetical protein
VSFKIGKRGFYRTRGGLKAEVVHVGPQCAYVADVDGRVRVVAPNGRPIAVDWETDFDLIAPWAEPEVGSREWVKSLPKDTPLWHRCWDPKDSILADDVNAEWDSPYTYKYGWFIVGTDDWAKALPDGSKVRFTKWVKGEYIERVNGKWIPRNYDPLDGVPCAPGEGQINGGWLLYTPPEPKPWDCPEDVPVEALVRSKDHPSGGWGRILCTYKDGIGYVSNVPGTGYAIRCLSWYALDLVEHSIDGGKTWKPCVKEAR